MNNLISSNDINPTASGRCLGKISLQRWLHIPPPQRPIKFESHTTQTAMVLYLTTLVSLSTYSELYPKASFVTKCTEPPDFITRVP